MKKRTHGKIISKSWALRLIRAGKAKREYHLKPGDGRDGCYAVLTRYDLQITDHYIA